MFEAQNLELRRPELAQEFISLNYKFCALDKVISAIVS